MCRHLRRIDRYRPWQPNRCRWANGGGKIFGLVHRICASFYEVRIPANVPFHHRIIDEDGAMLTAEWTWHSARPGERKTNCGGCHAHSRLKQPLDFNKTVAGKPGYRITDFVYSHPVIDKTAAGAPILTQKPKVWVVEYFRDVKPIFDAHCVSCHNPTTLAGNVDLTPSNAWQRLAYDRTVGPGHPQVSGHQATRWVRKNAATQSLLAWKVFGKRMYGRLDTDRSGDADLGPATTAHPATGVAGLTFMQKRTIAAWIDLGCLVDIRNPGTQPTIDIDDPFDDQMRPSLVVSGIAPDHNEHPITQIKVHAVDVHAQSATNRTGLKANSGQVLVTPQGATTPTVIPFTISNTSPHVPATVNLPSLPADQTHKIEVVIADDFPVGNGNRARQVFNVTPRTLRYSQSTWVAGSNVNLIVSGSTPGNLVVFFGSIQGMGREPIYNGTIFDLEAPVIMGSAIADATGKAMLTITAANQPGGNVYHQAGDLHPVSGVVRKTRPLIATIK